MKTEGAVFVSSFVSDNYQSTSNTDNEYLGIKGAAKPNLITYNTVIDACRRAGELPTSLLTLQEMIQSGYIKPDTRTYTSLISTVARKPNKYSGIMDPSLAFTLLKKMQRDNVRPNEWTYCALIDACCRCQRVDLALRGLRMMLHQKRIEEKRVHSLTSSFWNNEVGAWTSAIHACGKCDRIETAKKLFHVMDAKFNVKPNIITCGCLIDCLLKNSSLNIQDILYVLKYMQRNGLEPTEVMYTSLISFAGRMAKLDSNNNINNFTNDSLLGDQQVNGKAMNVYIELMKSLVNSESLNNDSLLLKVFLVFQEMKAAGATPDM